MERNSNKVQIMYQPKKHRSEMLQAQNRAPYRADRNHGTAMRNVATAFSYGDRFIPRRYAMMGNITNTKQLTQEDSHDDLKNLPEFYWRRKATTKLLQQVFGLQEKRILQLSDPTDWQKHEETPLAKAPRKTNWACKPRGKPCAFLDTLHDLPGFDFDFVDHNLVDWSTKDHIAASIENELVVWDRARDVTMVYDVGYLDALAYSRDGKYLITGWHSEDTAAIKLWHVGDNGTLKFFFQTPISEENLSVTSFEWTHDSKQVVCAMESGKILIMTIPELTVVDIFLRYNAPIYRMKFSPKMRYLACGYANGNLLIVKWAQKSEQVSLRSRRNCCVHFDWHPWDEYCIVVAEDFPPVFVVMYVPTRDFSSYYQLESDTMKIQHITFNIITAELLVSVSDEGKTGVQEYKIYVLSSLVEVVDVIAVPNGGARFMAWKPDGTKLAASSIDQTLTVWNFYPRAKAKGRLEKLKEVPRFYGPAFKKWSNMR